MFDKNNYLANTVWTNLQARTTCSSRSSWWCANQRKLPTCKVSLLWEDNNQVWITSLLKSSAEIREKPGTFHMCCICLICKTYTKKPFSLNMTKTRWYNENSNANVKSIFLFRNFSRSSSISAVTLWALTVVPIMITWVVRSSYFSDASDEQSYLVAGWGLSGRASVSMFLDG